MDKLATMDTIGSSFRPWLSCQGICILNRHQTGDTDSVQPGILLPVQRDSQETFIPCEARMLWYSADRTSSQQLRDTTVFSGRQLYTHLAHTSLDLERIRIYQHHSDGHTSAAITAKGTMVAMHAE